MKIDGEAGIEPNDEQPSTSRGIPCKRMKCSKGKEIEKRREWKCTESDITVVPFTATPGPKMTISASPLEIFFTASLLDLTVEETNRYAAACLGNHS